jgi:hypothetical protein
MPEDFFADVLAVWKVSTQRSDNSYAAEWDPRQLAAPG